MGFFDLVAEMLAFVMRLLDHFMVIVLEIIEPVVLGIGNKIPGDWIPYLEKFVGWVCMIDCWFPVVFGFQCYVAYYGMKITLNATKWLLKIIPGVW